MVYINVQITGYTFIVRARTHTHIHTFIYSFIYEYILRFAMFSVYHETPILTSIF